MQMISICNLFILQTQPLLYRLFRSGIVAATKDCISIWEKSTRLHPKLPSQF